MAKKIWITILLIILSIILIIFFIRLINPREIDDVTPGIPCEDEYLEKSDILLVIPNFNNISIAENKFWCEKILSLNKTLGMHGITHEYNEFKTDRIEDYLEEGIEIFEKCFGFKPQMFKPPQLKISENNKKLIKNNNLELKTNFNQITHKVYHCNDSNVIKNKIIDLI